MSRLVCAAVLICVFYIFSSVCINLFFELIFFFFFEGIGFHLDPLLQGKPPSMSVEFS
jgi:hypothetical protein